VFLEGPGGAGKKDLLWRLNKMGHEVIFHPYLSFLLDVRVVSSLLRRLRAVH
jgi:hypothetical protein